MVSRVCFLVEVPFTERDHKRFGVEILEANGFEVEIWDLTPFLNPAYVGRFGVTDSSHSNQVQTVHDFSEFNRLADSLGVADAIVLLLGFETKHWPIYRVIAQKNMQWGLVETNALPPVEASRSYVRASLGLVRSPGKIGKVVANMIPAGILGIKGVSFVMAGGSCSVSRHRLITSRTNIIWTHSLDYDLYLEAQKEVLGRTSHKYLVFLDEDVPFHPDYEVLKVPVPSPPENYYPRLVRFFEFAEQQLGCEVVIAAHPRSKFETNPDYFRGRSIQRNKTLQLVRDATLVISHASTSLNFAVLYEKPVVFVTTDDLERSYLKGRVATMAHWFGKQPIDIEAPLTSDLTRELRVDRERYRRYRECYIKKPGSEELPAWQILSNYLRAPVA